AKAGVGSAMNDVNRQVAGALGVAIIGSISSSLYSTKVDSAATRLPHGAAHTATDSVGGAAAVAAHLPASAADALIAAAHSAFTDAIGLALLIGTGVMLTAAPARQAPPPRPTPNNTHRSRPRRPASSHCPSRIAHGSRARSPSLAPLINRQGTRLLSVEAAPRRSHQHARAPCRARAAPGEHSHLAL